MTFDRGDLNRLPAFDLQQQVGGKQPGAINPNERGDGGIKPVGLKVRGDAAPREQKGPPALADPNLKQADSGEASPPLGNFNTLRQAN